MLTNIKTRIITLSEFTDEKVILAEEEISAVVEHLEPGNTPSIYLWYGPYKYLDNEEQMIVRQTVEKSVQCLLWCKTVDLDDLEIKVVEKVIGYINNEAKDLGGMESVESKGSTVGLYTQRLIQFVLSTKVNQSIFS